MHSDQKSLGPAILERPCEYEVPPHLGAARLGVSVTNKVTGMEGAIESFLSSPHTTLADYTLVVTDNIIVVWAAVQPAKPQLRGSLALIDIPDTRLRPLGLYIVGKLSRRRTRRLQ